MARGYVYKRCICGITGTPQRGSRLAVPACRRQHGTWWWRVEGPREVDVTGAGKRTQVSRGGYRRQQDAQEGLTDYLTESRGGMGVHDKNATVAQWLRQWLADGVAAKRWEPVTIARYTRHVDMIIPILGHIRLRDFQRPDVERMLQQFAAPVQKRAGVGSQFSGIRKLSSLDQIRRTLRSAMSSAFEEKLVPANPAAGEFKVLLEEGDGEWDGTLPVAKADGGAVHWQQRNLAAFLDYVADDDLYSLWLVAAYTGLRRAELCGLHWRAIDLDGEVPGLTVLQRVVALPGDHPCPVCKESHRGRMLRPGTKTSKAARSGKRQQVRWVPLTPDVVDVLRAQKAKIDAQAALLPDVFIDHGLVWPMGDGAPLAPLWLTQRHAELVRGSGQPKVTLHGMRHGAVSLLSAAGMPLEQIRMIVGHAEGSRITEGVYLHAIQDVAAGHVAAMAGDVERRRTRRSVQNAHSDSASATGNVG